MGTENVRKRGPVAIWNGEIRAKEKFCVRCNTTKPISEFRVGRYKKRSGLHGLGISAFCTTCENADCRERYKANPTQMQDYQKKYRAENLDYVKRRDARSKRSWKMALRRLGLTQEDYFRILETQGGVCAVCSQPPKIHHCAKFDLVPVLALDHDHQTGKFRGLLCVQCNLALGNLRENLESATRLVEYIKTHC